MPDRCLMAVGFVELPCPYPILAAPSRRCRMLPITCIAHEQLKKLFARQIEPTHPQRLARKRVALAAMFGDTHALPKAIQLWLADHAYLHRSFALFCDATPVALKKTQLLGLRRRLAGRLG